MLTTRKVTKFAAVLALGIAAVLPGSQAVRRVDKNAEHRVGKGSHRAGKGGKGSYQSPDTYPDPTESPYAARRRAAPRRRITESPYPNPHPTESPTESPYPNPYPTESPYPNPYPTESPYPYPYPTESPYPNPYPTESPYPNPYPTESPYPYPYPTESPYPNPYPTESPYPNPYPTESPYPNPYPTESPYPYPYPTESPYPNPYPTESPYPNPYPTESPYPYPHPNCDPTSYMMAALPLNTKWSECKDANKGDAAALLVCDCDNTNAGYELNSKYVKCSGQTGSLARMVVDGAESYWGVEEFACTKPALATVQSHTVMTAV